MIDRRKQKRKFFFGKTKSVVQIMVKKAGNQMENGKRVSQKMVFKVLLQ
jgi:hypothetical protein